MDNQSNGTNPEQKNFEQLFEEMNDLLHIVLEKIESPDQEASKRFDQLPPDLGRMFADLERDVNVFTQMNEKIIESNVEAGITPSKENLSKREQKCLDRSQSLIKKAEEIQQRTPLEQLPRDDNSEKERKKHLKRIRRGQTWKL